MRTAIKTFRQDDEQEASTEHEFPDHPLEKVGRSKRAFVQSKHELLRLLPDLAIENASTSLPLSPASFDRRDALRLGQSLSRPMPTDALACSCSDPLN